MSEFGLRSGRLDIYAASHDVNTESPISEVVERTNLINTPDWLENVYASETAGKVTTSTGLRIGFVKPIAPYANYDLMPMIFPEKIDTSLKTQEIYDFRPSDQLTYWKTMAIGLEETRRLVENDLTKSGVYTDPFRVFSTQNSNCFLSNENFRAARTIKLIHFRLIGFLDDLVISGGKAPDHLFEEWGILREGSNRLIKAVKAKMPTSASKDCDFVMRNTPPYGYGLVIPYPSDNDLGNKDWLKMVSKIAKSNHLAYKKICNSGEIYTIFGKENVIFPQPSYRSYVSLHDNKFELVHSPIIKSHSGPIEAAGVLLTRSSTGPRLVDDVKRKKFEHDLSNAIMARLQ